VFLSIHQTAELCRFAFYADKEARSDLVLGQIRDEDDYTSNFTGAFRRNVNSHSQTGLKATSHMLATSAERRTGCDAAIIVRTKQVAKISLFEAKLPRLSQIGKTWDYAQTSTGLSHFTDQIERQAKVRPDFAVFEIFYCDYPFGAQPTCMPDELSSCVWHDDAAAYDAIRPGNPTPWSNKNLTDLLSQKPVMTIMHVLAAVCGCTAGSPIPNLRDAEAFAGEFGLEGHVVVIDAVEQAGATPEA
jgi:hypothetical protein